MLVALAGFDSEACFKLNVLYFDRQPDLLAVFLCPQSDDFLSHFLKIWQ